jgi:hypothetical protein
MKPKVIRTVGITACAIVGLGLATVGSASTPEVSAERCNAAEALVRTLATGSATALGEPAPNLRSAPDQSVFASWPGGPPPREILAGLNEERPKSVLQCASVQRLARKTGLEVVSGEAGPARGEAYTAYASLPALSSDGTSAASVVSTLRGGHGITQVLTLTKQAGRWKVAASFIVSLG